MWPDLNNMLQYLPGFGSVTAGGADDGSPVNDFTEEPGEASPQMRLEAVSPRTAVMCSQRALGMSPARSMPSNRSSPLVFDSPASASPTRLLQAERQYWAELTGRQVQDLHEVLQKKTDACLVAVEKLKKEIMERLRQDAASASNESASLMASLEQRLRKEHQTDLQAAIAAARSDLPRCISPKDGEGAQMGNVGLELEVDGIAGSEWASSKLRQLDGLIEEIGLRVDGLHVKFEEELTTALADERKTRGKAISDVCQYIEHVVALQDSDAKSEKGRTDAAVAGLEDRVQVLEVAFSDCLSKADAGHNLNEMPLSFAGSNAMEADFSPSNFSRDIPSPGNFQRDIPLSSNLEPSRTSMSGFGDGSHSERQASNSGAFTLFSEEMRESLKHIVRKVGDTMSKDYDNPAGQGSVASASNAASTRSLLAAAPALHSPVRAVHGSGQSGQITEFGGPAMVQKQIWFAPNGRQ